MSAHRRPLRQLAGGPGRRYAALYARLAGAAPGAAHAVAPASACVAASAPTAGGRFTRTYTHTFGLDVRRQVETPYEPTARAVAGTTGSA